MVESVHVAGKGGIRASSKKLLGQVSKKGSGEYLKRIESVSIPENGRICASTEKLFWHVLEKGRIRASTEKLSRHVPEKG